MDTNKIVEHSIKLTNEIIGQLRLLLYKLTQKEEIYNKIDSSLVNFEYAYKLLREINQFTYDNTIEDTSDSEKNYIGKRLKFEEAKKKLKKNNPKRIKTLENSKNKPKKNITLDKIQHKPKKNKNSNSRLDNDNSINSEEITECRSEELDKITLNDNDDKDISNNKKKMFNL